MTRRGWRRGRSAAATLLLVAALTVRPGARPAGAATAPAPTTGPDRILGSAGVTSAGGGGVEAIDPDGSNRRLLVANGGSADQTADGSKLVFVRSGVLHLANGDGSGVRPLGDGTVAGDHPRWSPDGTRVAYMVGTFDDPSIVVIGADGSNRISIGAGSDPDWSPDGEQLVFLANQRVWVVPARAGARATALTPQTWRGVSAPRWSPDGTVIAFGGRCLQVVHPDGSGFRCATDNSGLSAGFFVFDAWAPDSRSYSAHQVGFHDWSMSSWVDPATGEHHRGGTAGDSEFYVTDWGGASGPQPCPGGYWLLGRDGGIFAYGRAEFHGSTGGMRLNRPVLGLAPTPSGNGYWLVASDGGIFTFGDAGFHGSTGALRLKAPVVGMAATRSGAGYWLVASDGGIFTFGDAPFLGSTGALRLRSPIVGMAPTPTGQGYWLVAGDGGVFTFGDASFQGSASGMELLAPIIGIVPSASGRGYNLVGGNGTTLRFGDAPFLGPQYDADLSAPVTAVAGVPAGDGVLLSTGGGEVAALAAARYCGSARQLPLAAPIVGAAVQPAAG